MAVNPMQRKSRNSLLIGLIIGLVIAAGVGALLFNEINKLNETIDKENKAKVMVYVLNTDVTAGQTLTSDMFSKMAVNKAGVPENAVGDDIEAKLGEYSLADKEGNPISTDKDGNLVLKKGDTTTKVFVDDTTGLYYTGSSTNKNFIDTTQKPVVAAVDMYANTVITSKLIKRTDLTSDVRKAEYNMVVLPVDLVTGEYVDIRLMLPNGQDFIVVSKKAVEFPEGINNTIWMNLSEEEILIMSSAIVEAYKINGAKLYAIKYVDSGSQEAAIATYVPSGEVTSLISSDENIVNKASEALKARYSESNKELRNNYINDQVGAGTEENAATGMQESITTTKTDRQTYLESLGI